MQVKVLYFAMLRDRAGVRHEPVELDEPATVGDLIDEVGRRHPSVVEYMGTALASVNHEFAERDQALHVGDEVAFFPPVSGGAPDGPTHFAITEDPLDLNAILEPLVLRTTGAACVFSGVVRAETNRNQQHKTEHLEYEAYRPMAEAKMRQVAGEIRQRWPAVEGIAIVQRIGRLEPGTPTVLIACTAAHRDQGVFEAARYGIDRLKEIVPIWKKEVGPDGEVWVEGSYHPGPEDREAADS